MATRYPDDFPCILISGYRLQAQMGVARTQIPMHQVQRRIFTTMPHAIALSFAMSVTEWGSWQPWVMTNAYDWFEMNLPSLYAGLVNERMTPHLIRFTSGFTAVNITDSHVQISVNAEMAPSMIGRYLEAV